MNLDESGLDRMNWGEPNFPWEDIERSRKNRSLQKRHPISEIAEHRKSAKPCRKCGKAGKELAIFYFESPPETWELSCGRAGWLSVCDDCQVPVEFLLEYLS